MTSRQNSIFESIVRAYKRAREISENRNMLEIAFRNYQDAANKDLLSSIEDIATLFFLGMFQFGEG